MAKKYGNEIAQKSISVKEKAKQTCMQRYGSVTPLGNSSVKKKWFSAFETKHGARNPMYIDLFKRKSVATKLNLNPNDIIFTKERTFDFDNRQINYKEYSDTVRALTTETLLKNGNNYLGTNWKNKIGRFKNHVDHKFSIKSGFINGIEPNIVANIENLHIMPWQDNLLKGSKDLISINELLLLIENKNKQ